ncbi:MAG TPA: ATP-binding protein [Ktedonobacteraceae bacterium]
MERQRASGDDPGAGGEVRREYEDSPEYLRDILRYVVEIGASLRLQMDTETLLKRIVTTSCQALRFRYAAIYLDDGTGFFRVASTSGVGATDEDYLHQHPLPNSVVAQIIDDSYRISDSYFLPAEAPIWQDETFASYFVVLHSATDTYVPLAPASVEASNRYEWHPKDLMLVPLVSGDEQLLGFLTPDFPLGGRRPTQETMSLFELFANQAAVVIEGSRLSNELQEAVRQARASESVKNNFLLAASHELRTPLTAIQGYLELLGEYGETLDEASRARFIQNARRGCDELVLLLSNVLDATYLDKENLTFQTGPVDLACSVQTILEILEPIIVREKRQIEIQIPNNLLVLADELRLHQVLLNLLGNAFKYTPPGSRVILSVEYVEAADARERFARSKTVQRYSNSVSGTFVILSVRDWGPGVAPAEQPLLFTRFTRLEAAKKSVQRGAGLGLYLCRQLIEAMNGWIWMESSGIDGEGCCFFVALPLYRV